MPPSHHSHSSHHSSGSHHSSSSHHSHSSSHSYSGHAISSGPRETGTYNTRYNLAEVAKMDEKQMRANLNNYRAAMDLMALRHEKERFRLNQPSGYSRWTEGYVPARMYRCKSHDYVFYPVRWYDKDGSKYNEKGYYDEDGNYFKEVALYSKDTDCYTLNLQCKYCGVTSEYRYAATEARPNKCSNCGGDLTEVITGVRHDAIDEEYMIPDLSLTEQEKTEMNKKGNSFNIWIFVAIAIIFMMLLPCLGSTLPGLIIAMSTHNTTVNKDFDTVVNSSQTLELGPKINEHNQIYVEDIGRNCAWYATYESYYDNQTDCYFWYNTKIQPNEWQYWYEGISSDYGEYGWMEYDMAKKQWYIEINEGEWIPLPDSYDTSYLWHIVY